MAEAGQDHNYKKVELAGLGVDERTGCQGVISEPHLLIHQGKVFHWAQKVTGITNGSQAQFLLKTAVGNYPHIHRFRLNAGDGDIDVNMYEDTTTSADGTLLTNAFNLNRNSIITPDLELFSGPTVTADGTLVHQLWIPPSGGSAGGGPGGSAVGVSNAEAGEEWILKPDSNYMFELDNSSGGTITAWFELFWYEL